MNKDLELFLYIPTRMFCRSFKVTTDDLVSVENIFEILTN